MYKHSQTQSLTHVSVLKRDSTASFLPEMHLGWPSFHRVTRSLLDVDLLSSSLLREESYTLPPIHYKATPLRSKLHSQLSIQDLSNSSASKPPTSPSSSNALLKRNNKGKWKRKKRVWKGEVSSSDEEEGTEAWYRQPATGFSEVMDCIVEDIGAFPYLTLPERRSLSPMRKPGLHTTWWYTRDTTSQSSVQCTCRPQLYLHPSLHYQQLFLKSVLKDYKGLGQLRLIAHSPAQRTAKQVLIVHFGGVVGYWQSSSPNETRLLLRKGVVDGLTKLAGLFRLVLIVSMKKTLLLATVRYLQSQGIGFEGMYSLRPPELPSISVLSYSRVLSDLKISDPVAKVLVVSRLDLTCEEADTLDDLYWKAGSKLRLYAAYMPLPSFSTRSPLTLLVPNLEAQELGKAITFAEVTKAILDLYAFCDSAWPTSFYYLLQHPQQGFRPLSTSAVHEVLMSSQLPPPTAESFARAQTSHTCALHRKLAWGLGPSLLPFSNNAIIVTSQRRESGGVEVVDC